MKPTFSLHKMLAFVTFLAFVLVIAKTLSIVGVFNGGVRPQSFESQNWINSSPGKDRLSLRRHMISDLVGSRILIGKTKEEVVKLLGPPDGFDAGAGNWELVYWIGLERGGWASLDDEFLGIEFSNFGQVRLAETFTN